jgi:hypothetical protein
VYYIVLLVMAVFGLLEWQRRAKVYRQENSFEFES